MRQTFHVTLKEAQRDCDSYYEGNQLRGCTCGTCPSNPPVNESMGKECNCSFRFYGENKEKKCYGCGGSPIDLRDLEKAKRVFYDCFTETGSGDGYVLSFRADAEKAWQFIEILLSTARQEERERFSGWIAEAFAEANDIVQMQKLLRKKLNTVDSLTSKGGTNGL